jgi:hypothetical protein
MPGFERQLKQRAIFSHPGMTWCSAISLGRMHTDMEQDPATTYRDKET